MKVIMYSTHCPKCNILEKKLNEAKIKFVTIDEVDEVQKVATAHGFTTVPLLEADGQVMAFKEADDWINKNEE